MAKQTSKKTTRPGKVYSQIVLTSVRRMRYDIENWRKALKQAESVDSPSRIRLYDIYSEIIIDALLTSQLQNRKLAVLGTPFNMVTEGDEPDEEITSLFANSLWYPKFLNQLLDTQFWGHSLWEIAADINSQPVFNLIPRKHVRPETGEILIKQDDDTGIPYRTMREYGTWLIEAGDNYDVGQFNKAVPHILMKRFAQSCWSEFCEIFGMPMRTLKTNTSDPEMLNRAEEMMRTMGAANYSIIDESEIMEFAQASNTTGEVYKELIRLCNSEISMLVSGAILGQDTEHGTRGKEQVSADALHDLVMADMKEVENFMNAVVMPALAADGFIPAGLFFKFKEDEDLDALWSKVNEAIPYFDVDPEWITNKFGIPVTPKQQPEPFGAPEPKARGFFG